MLKKNTLKYPRGTIFSQVLISFSEAAENSFQELEALGDGNESVFVHVLDDGWTRGNVPVILFIK